MPMLLDQRSTSASGARPTRCSSLIGVLRPLSSSTPSPVSTESWSVTRPRSSSPAARNGFIVDPGSNGSVNTVADVSRGSSRRLANANISPLCGSRMTMSPPSAPMRATASASDFSAISCRSALIVSTTLAAVHRRRPRRRRRLARLSLRVANDRRGAGHPTQNRVERELESVDGFVVAVDVTENALRALRHEIRARRSPRTSARRAARSPAPRRRREIVRAP